MTRSPIVDSSSTAVRVACLALVATLAGCSTVEGWFSSDKVDYNNNARQTAGLQVPPDLTQLAKDSRSQIQGGSVSAAALAQQQEAGNTAGSNRAAAAPGSRGAVALNSAGDASIERSGSDRWVHTSLTPEQTWPQVLAFWKENGFEIASSDADTGMIETNWIEDKSKLPQDFFRRTIGKVFDSLYSTGERDMYRARVERDEKGGTDIFISHRGKTEVYTNTQKDNTGWQDRPSDPLLEAQMLSRLMLKLGGKTLAAPTTLASADDAASAPAAPVPASVLPDTKKARPLSEVPDQLVVNDNFERAWRRVGQSLDRHGFTIEDRDRTLGMFFLRYADPSKAGQDEPNFFQRLFSSDKGAEPIRYRVLVKAQGQTTVVSILDNKGQAQTNDIAKGILNLLMDDLR
ncbi:outer membrane protein assembly factor BamC [Paucibacter sp. R3-3]|uniref:Outer membrane protein assembly factor BamC n=1 Tax=Roseateles agri TaxID=3098619 RepID=A0ABU5DKC1_9BURK|nr:outer membrane protein assembly factor BamC [Paucibacter sp. R3-3]MDY0746178.1 outer membrane protein assembly factor BamC [Paucibacter sp. R3-3]